MPPEPPPTSSSTSSSTGSGASSTADAAAATAAASVFVKLRACSADLHSYHLPVASGVKPKLKTQSTNRCRRSIGQVRSQPTAGFLPKPPRFD
jgi:hypothetical protein